MTYIEEDIHLNLSNFSPLESVESIGCVLFIGHFPLWIELYSSLWIEWIELHLNLSNLYDIYRRGYPLESVESI